MKASDFIVEFLADQGVGHAFVLTGGAVAHLIDSVGCSKKMKHVCVQHEQAGSMAAEGYARVSDAHLGLAMATSGPGATNLLTGIACAWFDSIPVIYITGQVNTFESKGDLPIRQMGFQETDIVSMAKPITKWAHQVKNLSELKANLQEAIYHARRGRQGPVLLDIPFDFQRSEVDPDKLSDFIPPDSEHGSDELAAVDFASILQRLSQAERPVFIAGGGIRCANAQKQFLALVEQLQIPVVTSWSGLDLIANSHPLYRGQIGVYGARAANFTVQNADFVLSVGSRLDSRQTGGKYKSFARAAYKVIVDIDPGELHKNRVTADCPVVADAKSFMELASAKLRAFTPTAKQSEWLKVTQKWRDELPVYDSGAELSAHVNPYCFFDCISDQMDKQALVYLDTGATLTWAVQALRLSGEQRVMSAFGNSPMGYALPAAIGAAFACPSRQIVSVNGDGGYQLNIQELQTIRHYNLPIKIIIMNNRGYGIIKQFQSLYLEGREIATGSGYSIPNFGKISAAYDLPHFFIESDKHIEAQLRAAFLHKGAAVIEVNVELNQKIEPKLGWGKPIEDQLPEMPRAEFAKYMMVPEYDDVSPTASKASRHEIN